MFLLLSIVFGREHLHWRVASHLVKTWTPLALRITFVKKFPALTNSSGANFIQHQLCGRLAPVNPHISAPACSKVFIRVEEGVLLHDL